LVFFSGAKKRFQSDPKEKQGKNSREEIKNKSKKGETSSEKMDLKKRGEN